MDDFTEEEKKLLRPYFSNLDKRVFCLVNLPEVVKGALFSRYSRTDLSLRKVLLDEFINRPEMELNNIKDGTGWEVLAVGKAEKFYERVLVGFGDDSVAELGGCHIAVEGVSQIAAKFIESARLGISPLEKSTRYIWFDRKTDGKYRYLRPDRLMNSEFADDYTGLCDMLFDTYTRLIPALTSYFKEKFPKTNDISERGYEAVIRAKACDALRVFLPAATLTNLGLFGNGRAFEYLLTKMYSSQLEELSGTARMMQQELEKIIPSFVKRADDNNHGAIAQEFLRETANAVAMASQEFEKKPEISIEVQLVDYDKDAEPSVLAAILYPHSRMTLPQLRKVVSSMPEDAKKRIISEYLSRRKNRRHKPGRAFENIYYTFDILANYGIYRDLQRHRILTQEPQDLTTAHGYDTPKDLVEAGFGDDYSLCMKKARELYDRIFIRFPKEAQYVVPFGYRIRWYVKMNLREAFHYTELRSSMQGHADYRRVAQQIAREVKRATPLLTEYLSFVDFKTYELERLESEKKIDRKIGQLDHNHRDI